MDRQQIKQRFGIIGNSPKLNQALDVAIQVANTDLTVLITGESGSGKEIFSQILHHLGPRKHGTLIPVNCGAIPEGTIDSELFGHEKGAFTGAHDHRKGYFEVANKGTIFLDEVAELPLSTQVRLLRVLELGEFIKVGSSKIMKTDVRVIAATNVDVPQAIQEGKFREDLYYRLNTVPLNIPPLRERQEDIHLLFRKFTQDFAEKYQMPPVTLSPEAIAILESYRWPGNIRQLKNISEQVSIIEQNRTVDADTLKRYLPNYDDVTVPALYKKEEKQEGSYSTEREILYKFLFDMKKDMHDLKRLVQDIIEKGHSGSFSSEQTAVIDRLLPDTQLQDDYSQKRSQNLPTRQEEPMNIQDTEEYVEESLSLQDKEIELIKKALDKYNGKRKYAADELGISERTLYRKIKEYNIDL